MFFEVEDQKKSLVFKVKVTMEKNTKFVNNTNLMKMLCIVWWHGFINHLILQKGSSGSL